MSDAQQPQSIIEVKTSFFFLAFLLTFFKPQVSINGGQPFPVAWGQTPIPVSPGRYQVEVWVPYLFYRYMGKNGTIVDVPAGGGVQVAWRAPNFAFSKGKITVSGGIGPVAAPVAAPAAASGGWHVDPAGRHEQRYFDGAAWTDHVVDAGVQSSDPLNG